MKKPFFARHGLFVLIAVFFCVPFAMRGSRYAVQRMKNDVKDWLPADFPETAELDWFRQRFLGEQFILVSWDGCTGGEGDQRFRDFIDNLFPEVPPSAIQAGFTKPTQADFVDRNLNLYARSYMPATARETESFIGNQLSLRAPKELYCDWGGRQEKWIRSGRNDWVYITPKGELFQWKGNRSWPAQLWRFLTRKISGKRSVEGEFVTAIEPIDGPWYYEDPSRLNARLFKSVTTGPSVLSQLTSTEGKLHISRELAHERLRGVLFGPDDKQTCIVLTLTNAAKEDPRGVVGRGMLGKERGTLLDIAEASGLRAPRPPPALPGFLARIFSRDEPASSAPMLRLGGPPVDNAAIDEEGQITLARLLGLSLAVGLGLSWLCFRSITITIMVFLVGGISAVMSVGIVYWTGSQLDAVLMSMPSLVYVLGISGAVHVVNYYRESVTDGGISSAPDHAVKLGIWPCTMAALTTSLGLVSLASSNIVPIRKFGIYAAVGVIATLILLFTFLPAALEMWPPRRYLARSASKVGPASAIERFLDRFWQTVGRTVIRHYRIVGVASFIIMLCGVYGLTKIGTSVELLKLFDGKAKIIEDYQWLEGNLGKLVPMEIVVRVHPDLQDPSDLNKDLDEAVNETQVAAKVKETNPAGMDFLERMEISKYVAAELNSIFGEEGTQQLSRPMLASTFAREPPTAKGMISRGTRKHMAGELEENRQEFVDADFLRTDPVDHHELWRISLRLAALDGIDFGDFVQSVKQVVEPILLAYQYRETILKSVDATNKENPPAIFFVGYNNQDDDASLADQSTDVEDVEVDQTNIFVSRLFPLLIAEGIRNRGSDWRVESAEQVQHIKPTDVVVVLKDVAGVTTADLQATGALRLDARSHVFNPRFDPTAMQRGQRVSAVYTGLVPIVYKAQRTLLSSLFESTGLAFVMIAGVMMFLLRSMRAGLISMFPNVFPVVAIFGFMGLSGIKVDIGSMMTASVAMGVAVDDTIHFLSWFRKGLDDGHSRKEAILLAYRRVATAMTQTTAIGGIGLSIFAFSTFTPTQRFGALMLALLAAALVGDLLFLPALLASPLGKVFDRESKSNNPQLARQTNAPHLDEIPVKPTDIDGSSVPQMIRRDNPH